MLAASLLASPSTAQPRRAEPVLVLEAPIRGWKEGTQALVAELLTSGYELRVRAAHAHSLGDLRRELELAVAESGVAVGVSIVRAESHATAWLCHASSCEQLEVEIADGELARSRLALAVVERLRPIDLPATLPPPPREQAVPVVKAVVRPHKRTAARPLRIWAGGGGVLSSGLSSPLPWVSAALGATLSAPWGLEGGLAGSPLAGIAETRAGSLSLHAAQAAAFAIFEPFSRRRFGLSLGLGGGALYFRESASPAPGFAGFSRSATVAMVSARGRLHYHGGPVYFGLTIDPGMLVPVLKVQAGTETVLRIGRPWVALQASLGITL